MSGNQSDVVDAAVKKSVRVPRAPKPAKAKRASRSKLDIHDNLTVVAEAPASLLPPEFTTALKFADAMGAVVVLSKRDGSDQEIASLSIVRADGRAV